MSKLGEVNINHNGERMAIISECGKDQVEVIFEKDNSIEKVSYQDFYDGNVKRTGAKWADSWVGTPVVDEYNEDAKIVEYNSDEDVTVQYETGEIVAELDLNDVLNGRFNRFEVPFADTPRASSIKEHRNRTLEFAMYMLDRYRRCVMLRPCGFGKTWACLKLFESPRYQKCLFLHPNDDDLNSERVKSANIDKVIDSYTFNWLWNKKDADIEALDYDIVFIDEIHRIGGTDEGKGAYATYMRIKKLMETHPKTHFIGATATPLRMDGINVVDTMFGGHTCYPYEMDDAFDDGLLKRPHYYYCVYSVLKQIRDKINESKVNVDLHREEIGKFLKLSEDEINELDSAYMDRHISEVCHKVLPSDKKYMRFIAFYLTHKLIDENKDKVIGWFKNAYPTYQINAIEVSSRSDSDLRMVDALPTAPTDPKYEGRIDIIFNCEMLCMGYHSEYITGLILDRKTQSLNKYIQMIGRILSCDNDDPVIIFDVADNIHSEFICGDVKVSDKFLEKKMETVIPEFDPAPTTFAEVLAQYPNARHWDKIKEAAEKAKLSERLLKEALKEAKKEEKAKASFNQTSSNSNKVHYEEVTLETSVGPMNERIYEPSNSLSGHSSRTQVYIPEKGSSPHSYSSPDRPVARKDIETTSKDPRIDAPSRERYICNNVPSTPISPVYTTPVVSSEEKKSISSDVNEKVNEAWNIVKEKGMTFSEAANYLAGIEDMYGTVNPYVAEESAKRTPRPYERFTGGFKVTDKPYMKPIIPVREDKSDILDEESEDDLDEYDDIESDISMEDEEAIEEIEAGSVDLVADVNAKLGFNHWSYYYNGDTKEAYQKYAIFENRVADIEKDFIDRFLRDLDKMTCEQIIEQWHSYPGCEENYRSYSEVDKKTFKYKCLAAVSGHLFGEPRVELVLRYMIEGKVA